jgi:thioredoxin-like negative regulator of GroEL
MQDQRRQVAQARRHLKVARLVNHIHGAIQADDVQLTAQLIKELMQLKGPENPFVAKLKAYSLIRQDRLEEAKSILGKVLAHSANDFEAGLNMAVIDIKTGRFDQARQRLMGLQERFPEKESVAFCLKQLPR